MQFDTSSLPFYVFFVDCFSCLTFLLLSSSRFCHVTAGRIYPVMFFCAFAHAQHIARRHVPCARNSVESKLRRDKGYINIWTIQTSAHFVEPTLVSSSDVIMVFWLPLPRWLGCELPSKCPRRPTRACSRFNLLAFDVFLRPCVAAFCAVLRARTSGKRLGSRSWLGAFRSFFC